MANKKEALPKTGRMEGTDRQTGVVVLGPPHARVGTHACQFPDVHLLHTHQP